ncbi:LCP family protein [Allorhizocola rhizosphaerae]|uniref:LCP family protein n=1 Tax=Allorhizocola rhizosphaerae TaxID=1872709 RepID=UPI000E3E45E2|nr:LCP family protein [Allorhizocola rhizosphaerae]
MIEDEVRAAFARREGAVFDLSALRKGIDRAAVKRRRKRLLRVPGAAAAVAMAAVLVVPGMVERPSVVVADGAGVPAGALNVLVLGLDEVGLADSVTLVHVPGDRSAIQLVALPRDLRVDLPGGGVGKLNDTYRAGVVDDVVERLVGVRLDAAVAVKLSAVAPIVDGLGGVRVCLPGGVPSLHRPGVVYPPGCKHYSGEEAADLMRQRQRLALGAFERDRNVQRVVAAVWAKARDADPVRLARLVAGAGVAVDGNLWELGMGLREIGPSNVVGLGQPHFGGDAQIDGVHYVLLDPGMQELFAALRGDTVGAFAAAHPQWVTPLAQR